MKHLVIKSFIDKETGKGYNAGSTYESDDSERVAFLIDAGFLKGSQKDDFEFPKHIGGGYYELSNGEKVKGKDEAIAAEEELKKAGE